MPFVSEMLRQQAAEGAKGDMLRELMSERAANQIIQSIAQTEAARSISAQARRGAALQQAASAEMRRDIGYERLDMQRDIMEKERLLGLIAASASAAGALGSYMMTQTGEESEVDLERVRSGDPEYLDEQYRELMGSDPAFTDEYPLDSGPIFTDEEIEYEPPGLLEFWASMEGG